MLKTRLNVIVTGSFSFRLSLVESQLKIPFASNGNRKPTDSQLQHHRSSYFITRLIVSLLWNMSRGRENKLLKLKQNPKLSSFASEKHSFGFLLVSRQLFSEKLFALSLKFLSFPNNPKSASLWILKRLTAHPAMLERRLGHLASSSCVDIAASRPIFATIFPQESIISKRRQKC